MFCTLSKSADKMGFFQYFAIVVLYQFQGSDIVFGIKGVDVFLFEVDFNADLLLFTHSGQAGKGIAGKSTDRFRDN